MADKLIDYDGLAQEALRGVVKGVLELVLNEGIPGDHHFYIAFDTRAPGVTLSKRLREQYPDEMTIVLQHRFWDLKVEDDRFEVKLTFDSIPELLGVPYRAIKVFFDPSVPYGLQFEPSNGPAGANGRAAPAIVEFVGAGDTDEEGAPQPIAEAATQ
ncbi:MAG: ClpXP protease specificity-enhancing factor SspB, partial [Pseudomonadota bacterium]